VLVVFVISSALCRNGTPHSDDPDIAIAIAIATISCATTDANRARKNTEAGTKCRQMKGN
jgi:hypothetical protein